LAFKLKNDPTYQQALIHKSANKELNNERLEFLGDAVLNITVTEHLFKKYPKKDEGFLSKKRAFLVARKQLNTIGKKLINKLEIKHKNQTISPNMYGNTLEAIIGVMYIDKGIKKTQKFIYKKIIHQLDSLDYEDSKSKLILWGQQKNKTIIFKTIKEKGLQHKKQYLVTVSIDKKIKAEAWGGTIRDSEQNAAKEALKNIF